LCKKGGRFGLKKNELKKYGVLTFEEGKGKGCAIGRKIEGGFFGVAAKHRPLFS